MAVKRRRSHTRASLGVVRRCREPKRRTGMLLATTTVEDFDRFTDVFSTKGAEKRKQHGSKGAHVFRDPNQADRVWVIFDWDLDGWQSFASDPAGGRAQGPAAGARVERQLRGLGARSCTTQSRSA